MDSGRLTERITIRLTRADAERLEAEKTRRRCSEGAVVRLAFVEWLAQQQQAHPVPPDAARSA